LTAKLDIHCQKCCTDWQKDKNQNYAKATCTFARRAVAAGGFSDPGWLRLKPFLMARMTEKSCFATAPSLNRPVVVYRNRFAPRAPERFFFRHPLWHELANDDKHSQGDNNGDCNIFLTHKFLQANEKAKPTAEGGSA
jgi:hypothetical protein